MTLPDQTLFSTAEACKLLSLSESSVRRLIAEGQLVKVYPRPRSMRITKESIEAHLMNSTSAAAVRASIEAKAQAAKVVEQQHQEEKKKSLADRWGLGNIFGSKAG